MASSRRLTHAGDAWGLAILFALSSCAGVSRPSGRPIRSSSTPTSASNPAPLRPPQSVLFQVILNVRDMDRQVSFYRDVMGLDVTYPTGLSDFSEASFVRFGSGPATLALHAGRTSEISSDEPRLSFRVPDIESTRAYLIEKGIEVGAVRSPAPGILVVDARDPEGNAFHCETHVK